MPHGKYSEALAENNRVQEIVTVTMIDRALRSTHGVPDMPVPRDRIERTGQIASLAIMLLVLVPAAVLLIGVTVFMIAMVLVPGT